MATTIYPTVPLARPADEPWPVDENPIGIQADEMFARQLDTGFAAEMRTLLHDPATGLAGKAPEEALVGVAEAMPLLGELKDRALAQAIGPRQRRILEPMIDSRIERATGELGRIAQQATSVLDDGIVAERIAGLRQDAALAWHDPAHLRTLGRAAVSELRYQGKRRGWDETRTDTTVRNGLSDLYAGSVETAISQDLDRAAKLYEHARDVIQPARQAAVERRIERAREERRVADVVVGLADTPDDPRRRPDLDDYQARAAGLTPPEASSELRARVSRMARIEQARADRAWQAARGRAAMSAVDWLGTNPAASLVAMPAEIRDRLSPEQTERLEAAAINGGRVVTDRSLYDALDDQAVRAPESFAGLDLAQYRLSLGDVDFRRLIGFQKALVDGQLDAAFERHGLGRLFLDEGLHDAGFPLDGTEARTARQRLERLLNAVEPVEGRPPTMADICSLVHDVLPRAEGDPNILQVRGELVEANGNTEIVKPQESVEGRRGIAPPTEPDPGSPEFRAAHLEAVGEIVRLPNGTEIPDKNSPTGYVMSPDTDLAKVAADGRRIGKEYASKLSDPNHGPEVFVALMANLGMLVGQGGTYDYQRRGSWKAGYTQLPHFRNISNINVGLVGQQAGLTLHELLAIAGAFAKIFSSNSDPADKYGLSAQTRRYIEEGYKIGSSGAFGPAVSTPGKR